MAATKALRDEPLNRPSDQLMPWVPEHQLGLPVHDHDLAGCIDADHRIRRELEQLLELALGRTRPVNAHRPPIPAWLAEGA